MRFGDAEDRVSVRRELDGGLGRGTTAGDLRALESTMSRAHTDVLDQEAALTALLEREQRAARAERWDPPVADLAAVAPRLFDSDTELAAAHDLAAKAEAAAVPEPGWWARRRARRAERRWREALGAGPDAPAAELRRALEVALDRRAAAELASRGGTAFAPRIDDLVRADATMAEAMGAYVRGVSGAESHRSEGGRAAAVALAAALRAGRRRRRELLAGLDGPALVRALPLWVGTLRDIDDLLPATAGLFDLVVLDEASQIDQPSAAGALVRARRAVVVGDPRQLRHVSFLADVDVTATLARHDLTGLAHLLDLRRSSLYDVAAAGAPVTWLDEHHRSVPHLISFSARRFYDDRLRIATRHPAVEAVDAIDLVPSPPGDDAATAVEVVAAIAADGGRDIGVVTPFRALADELEERLLAAFTPEEVVDLGLRTGTGHAFQGAEHEHVVLALGLDPDASANRRRFVEDPNLLNVLLTRARRHLVVVSALPPPADPARPAGLLEAFLAIADAPPAPDPGGAPATAWIDALATELRCAGIEVRCAYPVGRWTLDLVAGTAERAAALDCAVDPAGPAAHLDRLRALHRSGWRVLDAWPSRWDADPVPAALDLAPHLR